MKKIVLFVLIFVEVLHPQINKINLLISKPYYNYTPITGTKIITATEVFLYGSFTKTKTTKALGSTTASKYIAWKINGGTYDSTNTLAKVLLLSNLTGGATYTYYCSTVGNKGKYLKGADSTFITPPNFPTNYSAIAGNKLLTFSYTNPTGMFDSLYFYYKKSGDANFTIVKIDSGTAVADTITGLTAHSVYETFMRSKKGDNLSASTDSIYCTPYNIYYVSTVSAGDSSADSWTNKKYLRLFTWSQALAGDTVYVDGGADSLKYEYLTFITGIAGSAENKIVITNGTDVNHNGTAIMGNNSVGNYIGMALYLVNSSYVSIEDLYFRGLNGITQISSKITLALSNVNHIDILRNTIEQLATTGISGNGGYTFSDIRILHNNIYTHVDNPYQATDGMWLPPTSNNIEIGYNILDSRNPKSQQWIANSGGHRDGIQMTPGVGSLGGYFKIHHNFFYDGSFADSSNYQGLYVESFGGGTWEVYDNVFVGTATTTPSDTRAMVIYNLSTKVGSIKIYNNTFYSAHGTDVRVYAEGFDTLYFKNNLMYYPESTERIVVLGANYLESNYNQYYGYNQLMANSTNYTWTSWVSAGYDANGENAAPTFVNSSGTTAVDFKLSTGSQGIDEGTTLTLFTDDYEGTTRPIGTAWDRGAFER